LPLSSLHTIERVIMADSAASDAAKPSRDVVKADREAVKEAKRAAKAAAAAAAAAKKAGVGPSTGQASTSQPAIKKQATPVNSSKKATASDKSSAIASTSAAASPSADVRSNNPKTKTPAENASTPATTVLGGVALFGNVSTSTHAKEISMQVVSASYRSQVHPSVLQLAQHLSNFTVVGADARAMAVLKVLRDFIVDYRISSGAVFSRDLVTKLGPQISFLVNARPLGASVGHAIRYLKYEISVTPVELNEFEVSASTCGEEE
jgi:translation initiation factor eIF-2B subunit delta